MKLQKVDAPEEGLKCPKCKASLNGVTHRTDEARPRPGDLSICVYCKQALQFTDTLGLKTLSRTAFKKLPMDCQNELRAVRGFLTEDSN